MDRKNVLLCTVLITLLTVLFVMEADSKASAFYCEEIVPGVYTEEPVNNKQDIVPALSEEDAALVALIAMAEAEGEDEEGKRLVIDVVFNRVRHSEFPDNVYDVIYQPRQFSPIWNGRLERCYVREDILRLVYEEFENQTNTDVIFFNAGQYGKYGQPLFQVGNHYFSSY